MRGKYERHRYNQCLIATESIVCMGCAEMIDKPEMYVFIDGCSGHDISLCVSCVGEAENNIRRFRGGWKWKITQFFRHLPFWRYRVKQILLYDLWGRERPHRITRRSALPTVSWSILNKRKGTNDD